MVAQLGDDHGSGFWFCLNLDEKRIPSPCYTAHKLGALETKNLERVVVDTTVQEKAHKPYEFGCKVSITTNVNSAPAGHFVLHAKAFHDRPYDGHTLNQVLSEYQTQIRIEPNRTYVDKGYQGHNYEKKNRVFKSGQKRGVTGSIKKELKRRSTVEPLIGHLKNDGRLRGNYLYGQLGDKINCLMVASGYNFKLILRWLRKVFLRYFLESIFYGIFMNKKPIAKLRWAF